MNVLHSCVAPFRVVLMACVLSLAALPAAGQTPTTNVGTHMGTFSVGEIQWSLIASNVAIPCTGTWAVIGDLPPGVSLRTDVPSWSPAGTSASLWGVATTPGNYPFTLRVTCEGQGPSDWPTQMDITALTIAGEDQMPRAYVGQSYAYTFTAVGNAAGVTWTENAQMPPELTLTPQGVLSGTPTTAGHYRLEVSVSDGTFVANRGLET